VSSDLIFGKYEVIRRLALGGMGEVFLARQTGVAGFDRLVILKSLLPELAEQEGFVEQFLDEARVAATLNHPNIVGIFEVGLWNGTYFIAMEHIHGDDLARMQKAAAKAKVGIPFQVSARIIMDAALGLDHAHYATDVSGGELNIVHRDISPQNIMVRGDGVTKVVDFGIAKASNRSTRTATGMLKGKVQYMPPEQVSGGELDGRSDQFALGVVLWELCTGRRLFKADNELLTLEKVLKGRIQPPSEIVPGFPDQLEHVIMTMLERAPSRRYARCKDAADGLRGYLDACSRTVGEAQVAEFVQKVLGEQLAERTANLEPTQDKNFLISFGDSGPQAAAAGGSDGSGEIAVTPTRSRTYAALPQKGRNIAAITAGISAAVALAAIGFVTLFLNDDPAAPQPPVATAGDDQQGGAGEAAANKAKVVVSKRTPSGTVLVIDEPPGATVLVDDKEWKEKVPTTITGLSAGAHHIVVKPKDGEPIEQRVEIEAAPAVLVLNSAPAGASVWVGGRMLGNTPLETSALPVGMEHQVQLTLAGHDAETVAVNLKPGERTERTVALQATKRKARRTAKRQPTTAPPPPVVKEKTVVVGLGYLTLNTKPWAKVSIDGQPYGSTPLFKTKLEPGRHTIHLVNEQAGINLKRTVNIKPGQTLKQNWKLQ
jgi:serine/threonine-protein kinase